MLKNLLKYKWYLSIILILIIVEPSINSVMNFLLQKLFNSADFGSDRIEILRILTTGFLLWLLKRLVVFTSGVLKSGFICNAKQDVKHHMFSSIMKLNTANIAKIASSGEYISAFTNDISLLETRFYSQIISIVSGFFSIAIMGSAFLTLNVKLAEAILIFGIVTMFVPLAFSKNLNGKSLEYSIATSKFTQKMKEFIVAYPTIKNYAIEQIMVNRFDEYNQEMETAKFEADYALNLANCVGQLMAWFMQLLGVGIGLVMVINGEIKVGTVIAAQQFASDLASPLQNIIINFNSIRSVHEVVHKLEKMSNLDDQESIVSNPEQITANSANKHFEEDCDIVFEDFTLEIGNKKIISHFSFDFKPGKKYLVVGLNGSGKSSLFRSLKKWFNEGTGGIKVNGKNILSIDNYYLSRSISYINEKVSLFSGTVKENIELFRNYNFDMLNNAVRDAKVNLDLSREISDEGNNISSGEQRRIEIARSLLNSAKVLIFDEVVSTLDIETAYEIEKMALEFSEKTVIFISHNFSGKLISKYDEILVMADGRLIGHGNYTDLLADCDYFKKICDIKFGQT